MNMEDNTLFELNTAEPIKGFPELHWTGKRAYTSTQYYPAQLRESYGEPIVGPDGKEWMNKIFWGDNLQVMSHLLREYRGEVSLIYIDPPFDSKADYKKKISLRGKTALSDATSFEEKQYGDIWTNDEYLQFMYERLILCRELLSPSGSIFVHCDWHKNSHIRILLDEVFGPSMMRNQITWQRSHAQGNSGQGIKQFGVVTDTIFIYSKTTSPTWNQQYKPYSDEVIERDYKYVDELTGERYRLMPLDGPGGAAKGNPYYEFLGVSGYWRHSQETMQALYENGEIVRSSTGRSLSRKRYLKDGKGTPITDLWDDLNRVSPTSSERVGYPTQKPEVLLERIINTASDPGDLVFDCFMGSGTTQAVAMKLGRKFIGADINLGSIATSTKRLSLVASGLQKDASMLDLQASTHKTERIVHYTGFEVYNVNNYNFFRNFLEARQLLIEALEIQPFTQSNVWDGELDGRMVKILPVNRIATKADLEELKANLPYKVYEQRKEENPSHPVEAITLVCMGHEPDLKAALQADLPEYKLDIQVVDILRDKSELQLKREAEAEIVREGNKLVIRNFYPLNLLQKLSLQRENVEDWRQLVDTIMIDWNYDGVVMQPTLQDVPEKNEMVQGFYDIPADAGTVKVKITDVLSESLELEIEVD